jgi:hypothetical protein
MPANFDLFERYSRFESGTAVERPAKRIIRAAVAMARFIKRWRSGIWSLKSAAFGSEKLKILIQ